MIKILSYLQKMPIIQKFLYSNSLIIMKGDKPSYSVSWRTFVVNQLSRMNGTYAAYPFKSEEINGNGHAVFNLKEPAYTDM